MKGRQKVQRLIDRLRNDSERCAELAVKFIDRAQEANQYVTALELLVEKLPEDRIDELTLDWENIEAN